MLSQQTQINIDESVDSELQTIANSSSNEECALLLGSEDDGICNVDEFIRMTNIDASPVSFQFSTNETINAFKQATIKNKNVIAIWHSHPEGMPYPSNKDHHYMNSFPLVWVIYAKRSRLSRSFIRVDNMILNIRTVVQ